MRHGNINTSRDMEWIAAWDDYDGAPDAHESQSVIGTGKTEQAAIRELIELTHDMNEDDERISEYNRYLSDKADAMREDYHEARREGVILEAHNDR